GRSIALDLGFHGARLESARMHPFFIDTVGRVTPMADGTERRNFLGGLAKASARLQNTAFLQRLERQRMAEAAIELVSALEQAARSPELLRERVDALALPRQRSLLQFIDQEFPEAEIARVLGGLAL